MTSSSTVITSSNGDSLPLYDFWVELKDGYLDNIVQLPADYAESPIPIVIAHGLGMEPMKKNHRNDITFDLWKDTISRFKRYHQTPCDEKFALLFTSRGHGDSITKLESDGTKNDDKMCYDNYRWPQLGKDLIEISRLHSANVNSNGYSSLPMIAFGQSMGAASCLYAAMDQPNLFRGLILTRLPRIWQDRTDAKSGLIIQANEFKKQKRNSKEYLSHLPLLAAAGSDLPSDPDVYKIITCPVLILSHGEDLTHPVSSAISISNLIPRVSLDYSAKNELEARKLWPSIISKWLINQNFLSSTQS